jgi:hypothetical protein
MREEMKRARRPWRDPDDAPQTTDKWVAEADLHYGKKLVRRGQSVRSGRKTKSP